MQTPPLDPAVRDVAPADAVLTGYDEQHLVTYLRLLDAAAEGADWREVARIVLHIDPDREPERARRAWETPLRARRVDDKKRISASAAGRRAALGFGFLARSATRVALRAGANVFDLTGFLAAFAAGGRPH